MMLFRYWNTDAIVVSDRVFAIGIFVRLSREKHGDHDGRGPDAA